MLEKSLLDGRPVGLQLDCYHLEYFTKPIHFAAHFVAAYGCDEQEVYVVDTQAQGSTQRTTRKNLEAARFEKGPMSARARSWTLTPARRALDLGKAVRKAVRANARDFLSPPFKGASYLGMGKLADSLPDWLEIAKDPARDLDLAALFMEKAGTGGSLFRNFYRDFLLEAREHVGASPELRRAHATFTQSADEWRAVAELIGNAGRTADAAHLRDAATRCRRIAQTETEAMRQLAAL
jgi:hypothetical protein